MHGEDNQGYRVSVLMFVQEIRLGLHRSDYMLDEQTKSLLQIEMNTISSSFPGLSCLVTELHRLIRKTSFVILTKLDLTSVILAE